MEKKKIIILEKKFYIHPVFSDYAASKDGKIFSLKSKKILKPQNNGMGYLIFSLYWKKEKKSYKVHRFVFEAIKGVIPDGYEINHKNEIKTDNRIKNLELMTHKQNVNYSDYKKNKNVIAINLVTGEKQIFISLKIAGENLGINRNRICDICRKRKYCKSAISKNKGEKYSFRYLEEEDE